MFPAYKSVCSEAEEEEVISLLSISVIADDVFLTAACVRVCHF